MPDASSRVGDDDVLGDAVDDDVLRPVTPTAPAVPTVPRTPTTPASPLAPSLYSRPSPAHSLTRQFNIHALGFNTSPLDPLGRHFSFDDSNDDADDDDFDINNVNYDGYTNSSFDGNLEDYHEDMDGGADEDEDEDEDDQDEGVDNDPLIEDRKDVLIDRLQDVVRHVSSYTPSSPSHSNRTRSTRASARASPAQKKRPAAAAAATTATATVATPAIFGSADENVMSALHAHIDEMEAVLAAAMAAEAVANAAAASSPRHQHRHYPWQRPGRRLHKSVSSLPGLGVIFGGAVGGEGDREGGGSGSGSGSEARRTTPTPLLRAAPVLVRHQTLPSRMRAVPDLDVPEKRDCGPERRNQPKKPDKMATDCEALACDLSAVLASLVKRSQESDTIQQALLRQLAAANRRTAELEQQVKALTDDQEMHQREQQKQQHQHGAMRCDSSPVTKGTDTDTEKGTANGGKASGDDVSYLNDGDRLDDIDSELSFLRLQLRGIEVRCRSHLPSDVDPELTESIENWKADWSALRDRVEEERRCTVTLDDSRSNTFSFDRSNSTF